MWPGTQRAFLGAPPAACERMGVFGPSPAEKSSTRLVELVMPPHATGSDLRSSPSAAVYAGSTWQSSLAFKSSTVPAIACIEAAMLPTASQRAASSEFWPSCRYRLPDEGGSARALAADGVARALRGEAIRRNCAEALDSRARYSAGVPPGGRSCLDAPGCTYSRSGRAGVERSASPAVAVR